VFDDVVVGLNLFGFDFFFDFFFNFFFILRLRLVTRDALTSDWACDNSSREGFSFRSWGEATRWDRSVVAARPKATNLAWRGVLGRETEHACQFKKGWLFSCTTVRAGETLLQGIN
jgi:hypothetical protein